MSKICLNMIVKNESKIIVRLLTSVLPLIDTYCICDTGSTDNTITIIKSFFDIHKISGCIISEPFRDFGYNRSFALKQCYGLPNADYLLLLDADMRLELPHSFSAEQFKKSLISDAYYMFQGSQHFFYKNVRILKNRENLSYWGVTHEYVNLPADCKIGEIPRTSIFINDVGDGGSKTDKFVRDIRLLTQGLIDEPNNERYTFYLANSYRDAGQYQNAIDTYKKRIVLGGWKQEVWLSYYSIGTCYKNLNDMPNAIFFWLEGFQYYPERIENLYEIVQHYRTIGHNFLAYKFYEIADYHRKTYPLTDHLFYQKDVYDYKLDYEFSIFGYYCNIPREQILKSCMKVLNCSYTTDSIFNNVLKNYKFYVSAISEFSTSSEVIQLNNIKNEIDLGEAFVSSTPSLCIHNNKLYINTRYVDYRIYSNGEYTNNKVITTKNIVSIYDIREPEWKKTDEFLLKYNELYDSVYAGIEDIRILINDNKLCFSANRGLTYNNITIETGTIDINNQNVTSKLAIKPGMRPVEKNWVLFTHKSNIKVIYQWYPLTIGEFSKNTDVENTTTTFVTTNTIQTPPFFKRLRGSTNGVIIGDEIWFITHMVSDENLRYYYHIFVVLDKNTYEVTRYSTMFSFDKERIEYTLGFAYMEQTDQFIIGYSTNDCTTKYMAISKKYIDNLL